MSNICIITYITCAHQERGAEGEAGRGLARRAQLASVPSLADGVRTRAPEQCEHERQVLRTIAR